MRNIYIIGQKYNEEGIMWIWLSTTSHILYANENGYIPVVDMQHYNNQYFKEGDTYRNNAWEYFFQQPAGISLSDISSDDVITLSKTKQSEKRYDAIVPGELPHSKEEDVSSERFKMYRDALVFTPEFEQYLQSEFNRIIGGGFYWCFGPRYRLPKLETHKSRRTA